MHVPSLEHRLLNRAKAVDFSSSWVLEVSRTVPESCGVLQFQFGGKLVTFENSKPQQPGGEQQQRYHVYVSQVVTEKEFLTRSDQLQEAVQAEAFINYCQRKIDAAKNDFEKNVWSFLKVVSLMLLLYWSS